MISKFEVNIQCDTLTNHIHVKSQWITTSLKYQKLHQPILKFLVDQMILSEDITTQKNEIQLFGYTEYRCENLAFCSHPNYRNEDPWFDYVLIAWDQEEQETEHSDEDSMEEKLHEPIYLENNLRSSNIKLIPAKLMCFVKKHKNEMNVIIHSCLGHKEKLSVLTYQWELEYEEDKINYL